MLNIRRYALPLLFISVLALALALGACRLSDRQDRDSPSAVATLPNDVPQEFAKIFEVWFTLKRDHFSADSLDAETLSVGAVRGMLEALDDPYASYLTSQQYSTESQDFEGFFEGIGAEVSIRDGEIIIVAPIPDTPADEAGVLPGDVILMIDGESTEGYSLLDAVSKIRGQKGEPVVLLIRRRTGGDPVELTIVRGVIEIKSVSLKMLVGRIAHLRITSFTATTDDEVTEVLERINRLQARGLILDLRNNPGGLLRPVMNVTSQFLEDGLVLYEIDGDGKRRDWKVVSGGLARDIPMVVLVNEFSASGSEVLAGAIIDRQRATVLGEKTFGKGSVNTLRELSDGSGLYFTTALWYTPDGTLIEGQGLEPDLVVTQPEDDPEDIQFDRALEVLESELGALEKKQG